MKRIAILSALALCLAMIAPAASAQVDDNKNHGNFGVYADYFRLQFAKQNFFGNVEPWPTVRRQAVCFGF